MQLKSEIDIHMAMTHSKIIQLHSIHDIGYAYLLKMELFKGIELSTYCLDCKLSEKEIAKVMKQVLEGL